MNARDHSLRKYRKTKLPADKALYKLKRNHVNIILKKAKQNYGKNLLRESAYDSDKFWCAIKQTYPTKSKSQNPNSFTIDGVITTDK